MTDHKATFALVFLILLHGGVLLAGFLAPYPFDEQHRDYPYASPTELHFRDAFGRFHLTPAVHDQQGRPAAVHLFSGGRLFQVDSPAVIFLLGSDGYGRDVFSRVLYGGQISLMAGLGATFLSVTLGLILGIVAGFSGGWVDQILMRAGELVMALPWLYLLLAVRAFLPLHLSPAGAFLLCGLAHRERRLGSPRSSDSRSGAQYEGAWICSGRPGTRRLEFLSAAQAYLAIHVGRRSHAGYHSDPQYILAEVTLSFLGLGVSEPQPSWGNMLAEARQYHTLVSHLWMLSPGVILACVLFGYLLLSDALLDHDQVN